MLGRCVELIGAEKGLYTFKYNGLIRNQIGILAWANMMVQEATGNDQCKAVFVTNRKRDFRDHYTP